ncbi:Fc.00g033690.m01.CDS01 [Cosmosporella sp. VM-42]
MPYFQPTLAGLPDNLSFKEKRILITGANAGLGFAAARQLLVRHASEVIMAVRNQSKGETARAQLLASPDVRTTNPDGIVTVMELDLEHYASVVQFTDRIKQKYDTLDILLLNAATGSLEWEVLSSGHEKTIQVNLLSSALLAFELLPLLETTATSKHTPSRLTWVGSFVQFDHGLTKQPLDLKVSVLSQLNDKTRFIPMSRYSDSKLLSTMFVAQLSAYVDPKKVVINDVSPGMVKTGFGEYPAWLRMMFGALFLLKARSADVGAKTYLYALGVVGEEAHGAYLSDNQVAPQPGSNFQHTSWENTPSKAVG